jgi:hypothetical protein
MVVQRTLAKIEELKERPHHERRAIAAYGAIAVSGVLFLGWSVIALNGFGETAVRLTQVDPEPGTAQTAGVAGALGNGDVSAPYTGSLTASSTNGRVELVPTGQ